MSIITTVTGDVQPRIQAALLDYLDREARVGVFSTDANLVIQTWNHWLTKISGITAAEAVGNCLAKLQPEAAARLNEHYQSALRGFPKVLSYKFHKHLFEVSSNRSDVAQTAVIAPLHFADDIIGTVTLIEDVTERVHREAELRHALEKLESTVQQRTSALVAEIAERRAAEARLAEVMRRMVSTQEDERRRVARDLHDHLGQHMTALHLKLEVLRRSARHDAAWQKEFETAQEYLKQFDRELDLFTSELRTGSIYVLGLIPALTDLVNGWSRTYGIGAELQVIGFDAKRLASELETSLYRITQEALTNAAKHAAATSVSVLLQRTDRHVILCVEDDGVGFEVQATLAKPAGLGLLGLQERAALVHGSVQIESRPGRGTAVTVTIPRPDRN